MKQKRKWYVAIEKVLQEILRAELLKLPHVHSECPTQFKNAFVEIKTPYWRVELVYNNALLYIILLNFNISLHGRGRVLSRCSSKVARIFFPGGGVVRKWKSEHSVGESDSFY